VQVNESKIAFICFHEFFRIEPFQRVTSEKNKKNSFPRNSRLGLQSNHVKEHATPSDAQLSPSPVNESSLNIVARSSGFGKGKIPPDGNTTRTTPPELSIFLKIQPPAWPGAFAAP
jgi:hypothetical protein